MNPRSEWFKRNTQSESIRRIPTSDSWRLKDWSGFFQIQSLRLTRIEIDWFLTELHQTRLKTFFGLTRMNSDSRGNRFRNKSDWCGMNFNPKLLPGGINFVQISQTRHTSIGWLSGFDVWRGAFNAVETTSKDCEIYLRIAKLSKWPMYWKFFRIFRNVT